MFPILYQNHEFILYSYPLLMGLGWGVAYQIFFSLIDSAYSRLKGQLLFWGIFLFAWLGAKILFYLTYPKENAAKFLGELSFWTGGGFVFYGGLIGGLSFVFIYKFLDKKFNFKILWAMVPALVFGHAIGRIGCFLAGCCFGRPTDLFWGVYMHDHYRHPTQLIEAFGLFAIGLYLLSSKKDRLYLLAVYLLSYGCLRFLNEALRGDSVRGEWGVLTPSQWISLGLVLSGVGLILYRKIRKLKNF